MAKMKSFVYCESILNEQTQFGTKIHLIQPLPVLKVQFIPNNFSFSIFFILNEIDMKIPNEIRIVFFDPADKILTDLRNILPLEQTEEPLPAESQGAQVGLDFRNVPLECEGKYKTQVSVNGVLIGEEEIDVIKMALKN